MQRLISSCRKKYTFGCIRTFSEFISILLKKLSGNWSKLKTMSLRCTVLTNVMNTYIHVCTTHMDSHTNTYTDTQNSLKHTWPLLYTSRSMSHLPLHWSNGACGNQFSTAWMHQVFVLLWGRERRLNDPASYPAMLPLILLKIPQGGWPQN